MTDHPRRLAALAACLAICLTAPASAQPDCEYYGTHQTTYGVPFETVGVTRDVAVAGSLAYTIDISAGLKIIDIQTPAAPVLLGSSGQLGDPLDLDLAGDLAYVASGTDGLFIVDVTTPETPQVVGRFTGATDAVAVAHQADLAFVAEFHVGLVWIVDVANPAAPVDVASVLTPARPVAMTAGATHLYAVLEGGWLLTVDTTDPAAPQIDGVIPLAAECRAIAIVGQHLYLGLPHQTLEVYDIADPANPVHAGSVALGAPVADLSSDGDQLFAACGWAGLRQFDCADPAAPAPVAAWSECGEVVAAGVSGPTAVVANGNLHVFALAEVGFPVLGAEDVEWSRVRLFPDGDYLYALHYFSYNSGMRVVDVADPAVPQVVAESDLWFPNVGHLIVDDDHSYVSWWLPYDYACAVGVLANYTGEGGVELVSVNYGFFCIQRMALDGDHLYVLGDCPPSIHWTGLKIMNVADPAAPVIVRYLDDLWGSGDGHSLDIMGDHAVVGLDHFLNIIDVTDPATADIVSFLDLYAAVRDAAPLGDYLLVANDDAGLTVCDLSDPLAPAVVANLGLAGNANQVEIVGSRAYVAGNDGGADGGHFHVIDITDPTSPILLGSTDVGTQIFAIDDGNAYLLDHGKLTVVAVDDARFLQDLGEFSLFEGEVNDAIVHGGHVFATGSGRVVALPPQCGAPTAAPDQAPAAPRLTNFPNPFNPSTTVTFSVPRAGRTQLAVYDLRGRLVRTLVDDELAAGEHEAAWDGRDARGRALASGVYCCRLSAAGGVAETRKLTLVQ